MTNEIKIPVIDQHDRDGAIIGYASTAQEAAEMNGNSVCTRTPGTEFDAFIKSCSSETGLNVLDASEFNVSWLVSELSDCILSIQQDTNTDSQNVMTRRKCAQTALIANMIFAALTDTQGGTAS